MTCEVAIANRQGIALAADSAVTFRNGRDDGATYASGANKIFQLASEDPVAVMVYNRAELHEIPWEVVLKAYRRQLADGTFPRLPDYAHDLIDFINERAQSLLPVALREKATTAALVDALIWVINELLRSRPALASAETPPADLDAFWVEAAQELRQALEALPADTALDLADVPLAERLGEPLLPQVQPFVANKWPHLVAVVVPEQVLSLAILALFRCPERICADYAGLVIAGYGHDDYMPGAFSMLVCGFIGNRVYWQQSRCAEVNHIDKAAFIEPFARKSMIETFAQGASPEVWKSVRDSFQIHGLAVARRAAALAGQALDDDALMAAVNDELEPFTQGWAFDVLGAHWTPLNAVIKGLNVEELAELAETLVMLESLKEKVTSRTQGVGGPIDVAVITKSEGLVWIKRKHYFDPQINQRYLNRLQRGA